MALIDKLTHIADEIRVKTGGTDTLTLDGMAAAIAGIQTGGGDGQFAALVDGSLTDFVATAQMQGLRINAFREATSLRRADLSKLGKKNGSITMIIGSDAFTGCVNLEQVTLPEVLAEATDDTQWMYSRAFQGTGITTFQTDYPGNFGWNAVQIFRDSLALREVRIPNIKFGGSFEYFIGCSALELVEFGGGGIGQRVFKSCASLNTIVIRSGTVSALSNVDAFDGVTGPVTVYVNENLVAEYQQATNWATLYAAGTVDFVAIEGSVYV